MAGVMDAALTVHDATVREKVSSAEKTAATARLAVVVLNTVFFLSTQGRDTASSRLALVILALSLGYSAVVFVLAPYRRYSAMGHSYVTSALDGGFIFVWLYATGGFDSPFYILMYASILAVGLRYSYRRTLVIALGYAAVYVLLLTGLGQFADHVPEVLLRSAYVVLVAGLAGEFSREAFKQARSKAEMRDLNTELERRVNERTAQLEAANQELEAFSYSVSHDLRAPLRSMEGFSQVLVEDLGDGLDPQARDYLRRIQSASKRMSGLIDCLLNLSRLSRAELRWQTVDLSELAGSISSDLAQAQPDRSVETRIQPAVTVRGDPALLRVVLENLLGNAWKFSGKHAVAHIEFGRDSEGAYYVRDDGAGFDMAYASKLFGAFQRLHNGAEFEGSGIGLATVQRIVRRHGGSVWANGTVEQGATFYFTLGSANHGD
ncbi:MAG: hypothetical protein JOZ39_04095 [Chloroflexi bacterium]|nr:hypothetical protein [Chloroflexota bacterium]